MRLSTMSTKFSLVSAFILQFALVVIGLKLQKVSIPQYGWKDGRVELDCEFDLESDKLLVLKWYKDGHEFFRYTPTAKPPIMTFPFDGVYVDTSNSTLNRLFLKNISLKTGGKYKCEVSADRPTYKTLDKESDMIVIAPPQGDPVFRGIHDVVSVGDTISGNCTSYRSKPAAALMIYINGMKADVHDTIEYSPQSDPEGLETSVLGIKFQVEPLHFRGGIMELKCTATIGNGYWVTQKAISDASINAQPSIPGHNHLTSGAERERMWGCRGEDRILLYSVCGFLLLSHQLLFPGPRLSGVY